MDSQPLLVACASGLQSGGTSVRQWLLGDDIANVGSLTKAARIRSSSNCVHAAKQEHVKASYPLVHVA